MPDSKQFSLPESTHQFATFIDETSEALSDFVFNEKPQSKVDPWVKTKTHLV